MSKSGKKNKVSLGKLVKTLVTVALLTLIYSKLSLIGVKDRLLSFDVLIFLLVSFMYLLGQFLSITKWRLFLLDSGVQIKWVQLLKPYFIGMFVNTFGFGTVGGDLTRALLVPIREGERSKVVSSVIADRAHGLLVLLAIGTVASALNPPESFPPYLIYLLTAIILGVSIFWIFLPSALVKVIPEQIKLLKPLKHVLEAFPRSINTLVQATLISVVFHFVQIGMAYVIFKELGAPMTWMLACTTIPFINIASALPISIGGLGVRDAVSVYILEPMGVVKEASVSFAAIWVISVSLVSGIGGLVVYLFTKAPLFIKDPEDKL